MNNQRSAVGNLDARKNVRRAKNGDPAALREILSDLASHLEGKGDFPDEYASYVSDALKKLVDSRAMKTSGESYKRLVSMKMQALWERLEKEVRARTDAQNITAEQLTYRVQLKLQHEIRQGRLSVYLPERPVESGIDSWTQEATRPAIGRAFCSAFGLTRPQGGKTDEECRSFYVHAARELMHYGESLNRSIKIIGSAIEEPMSASQALRWLKGKGLPDEKDLELHNYKKMNLGFQIEHYLDQGRSLEDACSAVGRAIVKSIDGLSEASVYFKSKTLIKACQLVVKNRPRS